MPTSKEDPLPYEGIDSEGTDLGRIISLSDGIFAFAMTLLVINLALPGTGIAASSSAPSLSLTEYLTKLGPALLDYGLAFMILGAWWRSHHRLFSALRRYDRTLMQQNIYFLLLISVTPFILAVVFQYGPRGAFAAPTESSRLAVILFAAVEALTGAVMFAIWRHATQEHLLVDPNLPAEWIRYVEKDSTTRILVFVISIVVALASPVAGEFIWIAALLGQSGRTKPPKRSPKADPLASSTVARPDDSPGSPSA